ncbi:hypothetical protein niasHT_023300 [Heterodera trifolii]|uniref:glucuronosyltransferase n=1 Tax=Heterodera trifolii TaxID=157864 RepID=A0ABD2JDM6_9BILA
MKSLIKNIFALAIFLKIASAAPINEKNEPSLRNESKGKQPTQEIPPKLRILIIIWRVSFSESHYLLHRKLAELLASDVQNVEKVLVLAVNSTSDFQPTEEPAEYEGRLLVWTRTVLKMPEHGQQVSSIWEQDISEFFLPNANKADSFQLDFLTNYYGIIQQLHAFQFNVGIMETSSWDFSLSIFRALPTIKKFAISQSATPTISQWHNLGYEKIVGAMPGKDLARIGDHKFATENAIKENPNYFRERNVTSYIRRNELATKLVEEKFLEAIRHEKLPLKNFEVLLSQENFSDWEFKHRMDYFITNTQPFLDFPIVEQEFAKEHSINHKKRVIFIGGITMPKGAVPYLSQDNRQIFESANNKNGGVVLLSFGSVVPMHDDDAHAVAFKHIVVNLFSKQYPQMNLIIKWGERTSPIGMGDKYKKMSHNVYAKGWLEQSAILGNVPKLFITHGGQNSIIEAVKFGVPLLLFPFFGDQYNNAEAMAARGVAKVLDIRSKKLEKELAEALNEIFANYSMYKQKIEELSNKLNSIDMAKEFLDAFRQIRKTL